MLGTVEYITPNLNGQDWSPDYVKCGLDFEELIYNTIAYTLQPLYSKGLTIEKTSNTRDDGRDIIITSSVDFELFGINFTMNCKSSKMIIYIECKVSQKNKIPLDKFSKNILLANDAQIDYFILITNTTITPFTYFEAEYNAKKNGYFFYLVDQFLIANFLSKAGTNIGEYIFPESIDEISLTYQISKGRLDGKPCFDLFLFFRNNISKSCICRFKLKSDRNWKLSENEFDFILNEHSGSCRKITIQKQYFDGLDDILLTFDLNMTQRLVTIKGTSLQYTFEPPLFGEQHKQIITELFEESLKNKALKIYNLHGEAGIGKTRIIDEIFKKLTVTDMELISFMCTKTEEQSNFIMLREFLKTELSAERDNSLAELICSVSIHFKRYVIIIEDIHNAEKEFFKELSDLINIYSLDTPITIITAGRDDYSVYNENYIDYLGWIERQEKDNFKEIKIKALGMTECRNMITTIINGAPNVVIEKIQKASRNNPFYIVQFIEYLLETDLIYLVNRNTTGIVNIATFNQKIYIPDKIEKLLEQRFDVLKKKSGNKIELLLLLLGYSGIEVPKWFMTKFASYLEIDKIDFLFEKHFLSFSKKGEVIFDHETIYLFVKNKLKDNVICKTICWIIYENEEVFQKLPELKKGKIYFYINKLDEAEKCFSLPIHQISKMQNISAENLDVTYVEYLDTLYQIFRKKNNEKLQKNILLAKTYLIIHNISIGEATIALKDIQALTKKNHSLDKQFVSKILQLQAHYYMQCGMMSHAKKLSQELIALERKYPYYFDDQTKFDLFDRIASLYVQNNHVQPAIQYNDLSMELAEKIGDNKLKALAIITRAKINFFQNTSMAYLDLIYAKELLNNNMVVRINCHNELSIITAKLLLGDNDINELIINTYEMLKYSLEINYPISQIRSNYLLSVMYYLTENINNSKECLSKALEISTKYGIIKLLGSIYNMEAIIATYEHTCIEKIRKYYNTMLQYMRRQDQLFLGDLNFCYSNIINLTNYAIFLMENGLESEIYRYLKEITYYGSEIQCDFNCTSEKDCFYTCIKNIDIFKQNYQNLKKGGLIFLDKQYTYSLLDKHTSYYIPLGI